MIEKCNSLVAKIKSGQSNYFDELFALLKNDLQKMANEYYIAGSDSGDIMQECRIGLWKAIKDFDINGGSNFKNFAVNICCKRHLITAISHANRKKFIIHNSASSLDAVVTSEDDDTTQHDFLLDKTINLNQDMIGTWVFEFCKETLFEKLTSLEEKIVLEYLNGASYKDIAEALRVKTKTVDNALMRIRAKARELISSGEFDIDDLMKD